MGGIITKRRPLEPETAKILRSVFPSLADVDRVESKRVVIPAVKPGNPHWPHGHSGAPGAQPQGVATKTDLNARIRRLSTLLFGLSGHANELRLDLDHGAASVRCSTDGLDLALLESVTQARNLLVCGGTITVRTRQVGHHVYLIVAARDDGAAAFRFGSWRVPPLPAISARFPTARQFAQACHGRFRTRSPATLILKLPTVLKLAVPNRLVLDLPHLPTLKERRRENRQPIAA